MSKNKLDMTIQLLSCSAPRPDARGITKMLEEIAESVDASLARELTGILLDGSSIDIEVNGKTTSSAFRAIRKMNIDYEIVE